MSSNSVQVLMSVYNPDPEYLRQQLKSIDSQTYSNIEVLIHDDCPKQPCDLNLFNECLCHCSYKILPYLENNLGYAKAFERLIDNSTADILFFSDQDDIWLPQKVEKCLEAFKTDGSLIVVTDRMIIDRAGNVTTNSVYAVSNEASEKWSTGDDIAQYCLFKPYALGMSMAVLGDFARNAMPVSNYTGHDKWLMACGSAEGIISHIEEPLVQYRRHGNNVSGVLKGIKTKADYYAQRPQSQHHIVDDFLLRYPDFKDKKAVLAFADARINKNTIGLYRYRYLCPEVAWFEIVLTITPAPLFLLLLAVARKVRG